MSDTLAALQSQKSGIESQIAGWQQILAQPGASASYRMHAEMEIGSLQQQINNINQQILQFQSQLAAAEAARIAAELEAQRRADEAGAAAAAAAAAQQAAAQTAAQQAAAASAVAAAQLQLQQQQQAAAQAAAAALAAAQAQQANATTYAQQQAAAQALAAAQQAQQQQQQAVAAQQAAAQALAAAQASGNAAALAAAQQQQQQAAILAQQAAAATSLQQVQVANQQAQTAQQGLSNLQGEYSGLSTALGGTWGKTPQTLAQATVDPSIIKYTVTTKEGVTRQATPEESAQIVKMAVQELTPQQKISYEAEVQRIEGSGGGTVQEKLITAQQTSQQQYAQSKQFDGEAALAKAQTQAIQAAQKEYGIAPSQFVEGSATRTIQPVEVLKTGSQPAMVQVAPEQKVDKQSAEILKNDYVEVRKGEYLSNSEWAHLSKADQELVVSKGVVALQDKLTFPILSSDKLVTTVTGEKAVEVGDKDLILLSDYGKLSAKEQKIIMDKGFNGLDEWYKTEDAKVDAAIKAEKNSVQSRIDELLAKKAEFEGKSLVDRYGEILNTSSTGEQFMQKVLSFGQVKTENFDKDQVELDYLIAKKTALDKGENLSVDEKTYKDMVFGKQQTAADLGMQFVPFEYFRPERMKELEWWEAIVYPMLDVATLIPVVGLAAKGGSAALKGAKAVSKIASLGGKSAVTFAAKDAEVMLAKATAKTAAIREIEGAVGKALQEATDPAVKNTLREALKPAAKDVALAEKELAQITKNVDELSKLSKVADGVSDAEIAAKTKTFKTLQRVEQESFAGARRIAAPADIAQSAVVGRTTVANWDDLSPEQRVIGLTLAALPLGIPGKALNVLENVLDPFKIPEKAVVARATRKLPTTPEEWAKFKPEGGKIYAEASGGTTRMIIDEGIGTPEQARQAVASLQKQITEGAEKATAEYGTMTVTKKGTGLQTVVGKTAVSATPMGEIFKEGTGAFGKKTNLEKFLSESGVDVEIKGKPIEYINPISGVKETVESTVGTKQGVTVMGKEGGQYVGTELFPKFSEQAAFGASGKIKSGLLIGVPEVSKLDPKLAKMKMKDMEEAAIKTFNEGKTPGQIVEGFKQYKQFMENENVITGGTQEMRAQNLRSRLADKLNLNSGEYYTRTKQGKVELFQMYIEGGRMTPYTLSELYQLKGKALRNSLEDMFFGLTDTVDRFKTGRLFEGEDLLTKESQVAKMFDEFDEGARTGKYKPDEVTRLKKEAMDKLRRDSSPTIPREELRKQIIAEAVRVKREGAPESPSDRAQRILDEGRQRVDTRSEGRDILGNRVERPVRTEGVDIMGNRVGTSRMEQLRTEAPRVETPRTEMPRTEVPRTETPRTETPRIETPRVEAPRTDTPRIETPRTDILRLETPRVEAPRTEAPRIETPRIETPRVETPRTETPRIETPRVDTPRTPVDRTPPPRIDTPVIRTPRVPTDRIPPPRITIKTDKVRYEDLTAAQLEGAVAWRQGFVYKLIFKPFGQKDVINTKEPIPGVKYHEGLGSAAKSIVVTHGEIPANIKRDMGIVDIDISRAKEGGKQPTLKFKPDSKQKTSYSGIVTTNDTGV
jgi:hypothetical protein